jgi:hypothetical protein
VIPQEDARRGLNVDHDHLTGMFRGLLCEECNKGIGLLADDPNACTNAAVYLYSQMTLFELIERVSNGN